jgi:hypothetical protein
VIREDALERIRRGAADIEADDRRDGLARRVVEEDDVGSPAGGHTFRLDMPLDVDQRIARAAAQRLPDRHAGQQRAAGQIDFGSVERVEGLLCEGG